MDEGGRLDIYLGYDIDAQDLTLGILVSDLDADVVLILGSIDSVGLVLGSAALNLEAKAVGIPWFTLADLINMDLGRSIDGRIDLNEGREVALVEGLVQDGALRMLNVGSRESSHFELMQGVIILVKALGAVSRDRRELSVLLKLPVGPTSLHLLIDDISDSRDLDGAFLRVHTGAELSDHEGNAKSLGILLSGAEATLMPLSASDLFIFLGLAKLRTDGRSELAAVSMIVKNMLWRADLSTWRNVEAERADFLNQLDAADLHANLIWHLTRLKVENNVLVNRLKACINCLIDWHELSAVHEASVKPDLEEHEQRVPRGHRLVERIEANHIRVGRQTLTDGLPGGDVLIAETVQVVEQRAEYRLRLR